MNATQAAIRAGYSPKTAEVQGCRLLRNARIAQAVTEGKTRQLTTAELNATRVLEELRRLAMVDARSFYDAKGNVLPLSELTAEQGAALQSVEVIIKNAKAGDGATDEVHKIKLWDKPKALDLLAKHFGLLTEQVQHTGTLKLTWQS